MATTTLDLPSTWRLLEPMLAAEGYELVDVEGEGLGSGRGTLRVFVELLANADDLVPRRIDLEAVAAATRLVSDALDAHDDTTTPYTLEVSSPGLERPLRRPEHFTARLGTTISVKTKPGTPGERRIEGVLDAADPTADGGCTVTGRTVAYADIERARVVVVWGPPPKPKAGGPKRGRPTPAVPAESTAAPTDRASHTDPASVEADQGERP